MARDLAPPVGRDLTPPTAASAAPLTPEEKGKQVAQQYQTSLERAIGNGMPVGQALKEYVIEGKDPGTNKPNAIQAALRGWPQGASYAWSDEAASWPQGVVDYVTNTLKGTQSDSFDTTRQNALATIRAKNAAAQAAQPGAYNLSELVGAFNAPAPGYTAASKLPSFALRIPAKTALGAGQGALFSAGLADEDKAGAAGRGALFGGAIGAGGATFDEVLGWLQRRAQQKVDAAYQRAQEETAKKKQQELAQASGAYGSEVQKGSRQLENVEREAPNLTPQEAAKAAELESRGDVDAVRRTVIGSTLEAIPGQAQRVENARTKLDEVRQRWGPEGEAAEVARLMEPSFGTDTRTLFKQYGEPWIGAALGGAVGHYVLPELGIDPQGGPGMAIGALGGMMHGRTRAGKAVLYRLNRPGNQAAIWGGIGSALPREVGALAAPGSAVTGSDQDPADHFLRWMRDPQYRAANGSGGK